MDLQQIQQLTEQVFNRLDYGWTFLLLFMRYAIFFMIVPGIGSGTAGLALRYPAILLMALVSLNSSNLAAVPVIVSDMVVQMLCEVSLGAVIAFVPLLIVSGAQIAGHLASGTMGLNGAQMFDPSTQAPLSDLSRIYSDIAVLVFLLLGGHYIAIAELSGVGGNIRPGGFVLSALGLSGLIDQSAVVFRIGCLIAAPVIASMLLTNFVMGIISKAIPTINIFVVSFPLTIGVGFAISVLAMPEVGVLLQREVNEIPQVIGSILR
jgi:flagellar biosynthetic protein FliR